LTTVDQLKKLFQAFKEDNSLGFYSIARRIIEEEKAANHFGIANELVKALGISVEDINKKMHSNSFSVLQKEKKETSPQNFQE
jgi:DNA-directed RNA polymerase delta subunit